MRHFIFQRGLASTPAPISQSMQCAPNTPLLVAPRGGALQRPTGRGCALTSAVALAPVAGAANQDLHAATRAQKQSGRLVQHARPRQTGVCWTGSSTGATIKPHPVFDTVKGAAVGNKLASGDRRYARLPRCRRITAHPSQHPPSRCNAPTPLLRNDCALPVISSFYPTVCHCGQRACSCPPCRADRNRND